ncbi:MAG TPA: YdjY domain-containing protein [Gemmataceae bacterium]|jgi:hypothetical protein|nr:YdjY domain-containing protein [Gemmataceae bacterium]
MNLFGKRQSACILETLMVIFVPCMFCLGCEDSSSARSGATSQESYLAKAQPDGGAEAEDAAKGEKTADAKKVEIGRNVWLVVDGDKRKVMVQAEVCLREGMLEHLMCRQRTKEHEAVLSADVDARDIHKALIVAKAAPGKTVQFKDDGTVVPPTGTPIKVTLTYIDKDKNKTVTVPGRDWVRDFKTKKSLEVEWVFAGSQFLENPLEKDKPPLYAANGGDVICVSNFEGAMLDLPINSSKNNAELEFEAFTERIPPIGTKVTVILEPVVEAKKDKQKDPFKERQETQKEKAKDKFINPKFQNK